MTEYTSGSPGISFDRLLSNADPQQVIELLDPSVKALLDSTAPDLLDSKQLPLVCLKLIDHKKILLNIQTRSLIFKMLPNQKADELLNRLGIHLISTSHEQLTKTDFNKSSLKVLYAFFGLEDEERVPQAVESDVEECIVDYGLFAHQRDAAKRTELVLSSYPGKVLLHMPTGAGKTRTAMNIVAKHLVNNEPTLVCWLAQSAELLEQAANEFQRAWKHTGNRNLSVYRYWGKYSPSLLEARDGILIAGFAKLNAMYVRDANMIMRLGDRASLIVVDEAHQAIAPTYQSLIGNLHSKRTTNKLLGLSATPGRTWNDIYADSKLAEFFDSKKVTLEIPGYTDPVTYLESEGYLAKPTFRLIESDLGIEFSNIEVSRNVDEDYDQELLEKVGESPTRNQTILSEAENLLSRHKRVILFASSVKHAQLIMAILTGRGHDADLITGETPISQRERIIRKFKSNHPKPKILCNFGVLTTGFDAPLTSAALIARPTKSLVLYSQMVGRVIRGPKQGGNATAEIVTVVDPTLPGFGSVAQAFTNWEDVWDE